MPAHKSKKAAHRNPIIQRKHKQDVYGVPIYEAVRSSQSGTVLSLGYTVGSSDRYIRHWASAVKAAKRLSTQKNPKRRSAKAPSAAQIRARAKFAAAARARSKAAKKKRSTKRRTVNHQAKPTPARSRKRPTAASAKKTRAAAPRRRNKTIIVKPKRVLVLNSKKRRSTKRTNPRVSPKAKQIRETFSGQKASKITPVFSAPGTPGSVAKLGRLMLIETETARITPKGTVYLCADARGKLHICGSKDAPIYEGPAQNFGQVTKVEYEAAKPHLYPGQGTIRFYHKMGEEGGTRPTLIGDGKGYLKFRGGSYKIKREGIVN